MALVKIISGIQDSGKTTLASALEAEYRRMGFVTAGVLLDAEYTDGRKDTYYFRDLKTGMREMAVAASVPSGGDGWVKSDFSRFYFSDRAFSFAENLLGNAAQPDKGKKADYIFIDELGPLELSGGGLFKTVKWLVESYDGSLFLVIRETLISPMSQKLGLNPEAIEIIRAGFQAQ